MAKLTNLPTEILQYLTEFCIELKSLGSLLSTSCIFLQQIEQIDTEDFWLYLTSKRYFSTEISPLVLAPALDLYHIDLNNRQSQRNVTLPNNSVMEIYISSIFSIYRAYC